MPTYRITGVDKKTGAERSEQLVAATESEVLNKASERGVMVATCDVVPDVASSSKPDPFANYRNSGGGIGRSRRHEGSNVPNYSGLQATASINVIFGILMVVVGLLATFGGAVVISRSPQVGLQLLGVLLPGLGIVVSGVLSIGFGQAFAALRDIARNSFDE